MKRSRTWFLFISLIVLVLLRYFITRPDYKNSDNIRISGTVYADPIKYSYFQYIKIAGLKVYLPLVPEINYGDKIVIEGIVEKDKLEGPKITSVSAGGGASRLRKNIISFYQKVLPEPFAGLIAGIVLGAKKSLSHDFYDKTKLTGVAHVVVASGTNITFVVSFLISIITIYLPRRKAIPFVIFGIILYLFISGFDAPLIRAAIMTSAMFMSQETGRVASVWRIFFITMLGMLAIQPNWVADVGFWLSFASTGALLAFEKKIRDKLAGIPAVLRESFSTSVAAQIGVAPILFVTFGQFNILSPVINALVLWTVPGIMVLGALGGVVGIISDPLGRLILYLSYPLLWWFVRIVELLSNF